MKELREQAYFEKQPSPGGQRGFIPLYFLDHWGDTAPCRGADFVSLLLEYDCARHGIRGGVLTKFINHHHGSPAHGAFVAQVRFVVPRICTHVSLPNYDPVGCFGESRTG